jgi:hypothetical protein
MKKSELTLESELFSVRVSELQRVGAKQTKIHNYEIP